MPLPSHPRWEASAPRSGSGRRVGLALLIYLGIVGLIGWVCWWKWSAARPGGARAWERRELIRPLAADGARSYCLTFDETRHYRLSAWARGHCVWETPGVGQEAATGVAAVDARSQVVVWQHGRRVEAFEAGSGTSRWEQTLVEEPDSDGLRLSGDRVLVRRKDGWLECLRLDSGLPAWKHRFQPGSSASAFGVAGGRCWGPVARGWELLDLDSGTRRGSIAGPVDARWVNHWMVGREDAGSLDALSGKWRWRQAWPPGFGWFASLEAAPLESGGSVWVSNRHSVLELGSRLRTVVPAGDDQVQLLLASASRLVTADAPSWDGSRWTVRGRDRASGKPVWSFRVEARSPLGSLGMADWFALEQHGAVVVVQALGDPPRLRIDRLDFQSGRVLAHQDVTLRNAFLATLSNLLPVRDGMVFRAATRLARLTPTGEVRLEDPET